MVYKLRASFIIFVLSALFLVGAQGSAQAAHDKVSEKSMNLLTEVSQAMVEVVDSVRPSVVNISSTRTVKQPGLDQQDPALRRFFGDEFLRRFGQPQERDVTSLGSGVIVREDGYIITNHHVVKDADEIKVTLYDKRELEGRVIGSDPKTDIAVVKVDATGLPAIDWGDSDKLKVGETVIAVGIPFGLDHTVTTGIVSAKGRANVRIAEYEDFIQTDAAINPGNSGGPLVNVRGELVGINTAIFSLTGGYQGIGFAIPSNMALSVLDSLLKEGRVIRGWLGVTVQPMTEELAKQFGLGKIKGVLVSDVIEGSPAEAAGVVRGDVFLSYDGKETGTPLALRNMVAATKPGTEIKAVLWRDRKEITLPIDIGELPAQEEELAATYENALRGTHVQDITPAIRNNLGLPPRLQGVIVTEVEAENGLKRADVIMEVNRVRVTSAQEYHKVVSAIPAGSDILLLVYRNGSV
ncbi:MAG: DegQ family serine endoprotease, partial [Nitrospirota bacterium]